MFVVKLFRILGLIEDDDCKLFSSEKIENGFWFKIYFFRKGEYKLGIYVKYYDCSILDVYLCVYYVMVFKECSFIVGFLVIFECMRIWGVILVSYFENIFMENGWCFIMFCNLKEIIIFVYFKLNE